MQLIVAAGFDAAASRTSRRGMSLRCPSDRNTQCVADRVVAPGSILTVIDRCVIEIELKFEIESGALGFARMALG